MLVVLDEAFLQGLFVVVNPTRSGDPALQAPLCANLLIAGEKQDALNIGFLAAYLPVPTVKVVLKLFKIK